MEGIFIYMNTTKLTNQIDKEIAKVNTKLNDTKGVMNTLESELKKLLELRGALAPFNTQSNITTPIDVNKSLAPSVKTNVSLEDIYNILPQTFTTDNLQDVAVTSFSVVNPLYKYNCISRLKSKGWIETVKGQFQTYEKIRDRKIV